MRNIFRKIISIMLIIIFVYYYTMAIFPSIAIAVTKTQLEDEKSKTEENIENTKDEIENLQDQISDQLAEAKKLTVQISEYESEIEDLNTQITDLESQIKEAEANITAQEEEYARQKELLDQKVVAMAENGETTYLDVMLSSASLSEMISNYYLVSEVVDYDLQMMEEVQNKKKEIEENKAELELNKTKLDNSKETLESKMGQLKVAKKEKESAISKLTDDEKKAQQQLEELEEDNKKIEKELAKIAEEERKAAEAAAKAAAAAGTTNTVITQITGNPSESGYIFPLAGKSKANITTKYGSYSWGGNHTGVDIAVSSGTPIYAVKDGTVVISTAYRNSDGSYRSYGECVQISHGDGTVTLYGHGLSGSRLVEVGDTVKQGQQIMSVGSTGNSTGPHLHFEVRINGKYVNPTPYLP